MAASTTIAQYLLPRPLASFAGLHPDVSVQLESANTEQVVARVASGDVALGLIEGPAHRPDLHIEPWLEDELVLVLPAGHVWAGRELCASDLRTAPLLMRERGSGTRAVLEAALSQAGLALEELRITMELGSTEAILACVEAGLGIGFTSRFALRRQRKLGTLTIARLQGVRVTRQLSLVQQREAHSGNLVEAFRDHLRLYAKKRLRRRLDLVTPSTAER